MNCLKEWVPRIAKRHTSCRAPLEPGLKLALTLQHLASGSSYMSMRYGWRVPHNTQSVIVREVCQAIVDEYLPEVMNCPTTPTGMAPSFREISSKMEFSPYVWCSRRKTYCMQVPIQKRIPVLQLQAFLFNCAIRSSRRRLQIYLGRPWRYRLCI